MSKEEIEAVFAAFLSAMKCVSPFPKPLRRVWRRIAERGRPGDHFGEQAAGDGAERQAGMAVTDGEPQAHLAGCSADHRARIGKAWPRAEPGGGLDRFAERKQYGPRRHQPIELHRGWRRVAVRELGSSCEPDALVHRRKAIANVGVHHRPGEARIAMEMPVVGTLDDRFYETCQFRRIG